MPAARGDGHNSFSVSMARMLDMGSRTIFSIFAAKSHLLAGGPEQPVSRKLRRRALPMDLYSHVGHVMTPYNEFQEPYPLIQSGCTCDPGCKG